MTVVEVAVVALFMAITITLALGHQGGRIFNWFIDHRPTPGDIERGRAAPQQRDQNHRRL